MNADNLKVCPFCKETIQAAAKLCPRCRQWLSLRSFRHPLVAACTALLAAFLILGPFLALAKRSFERFENPPPYYADFTNPIQVIESRINWVEREKEPWLFVIGVITNQSPVAWRNLEFECRFYDANGVMVDAQNAEGRLTIQPNDDRAFRVSVTPGRPRQDYVSHTISVSNARNTKTLF